MPQSQVERESIQMEVATRVYRRAAIMMYLLAVTMISHAAIAIATGPSEKSTPISDCAGIGMNIIVFALLFWLGKSVSRGARILGTFFLVMYLCLGALMAFAFTLAYGYQGSGLLLAVQCVSVAILTCTMVCVCQALICRPASR